MTASIEALGDGALLLRLGNGVHPDVNDQVHRVAARLQLARPSWLLDLVPAYASLALFIDVDALPASPPPLAMAEAWLRAHLEGDEGPVSTTARRIVDVPVCYGGAHGPDLAEWSASCGLTPEEAVVRHAAGDYRVAMLGFAAGFPYLLGLDPALAMPRLATPRVRVPAGSVGIGGAQTGIYPREGPGGWRLIGRTPARLFDPSREPPALLAPGDHVRFVAIDDKQFRALDRADA